jgi:sortase (surface protein transpeptidase)
MPVKLKKTASKRRPAPKRSSLSARLRASFRNAKEIGHTPVFTLPKLSWMSKKRPSVIKKSSQHKKKVSKIKSGHRQLLALPLSQRLRLVVAVNRVELPIQKSGIKKVAGNKKLKAVSSQRSKKRQLAFSTLLILAGLIGAVFFGMQTIASPIESSHLKPIKAHKPVAAPKEKQFLARSEPITLRIPAIEMNTALTTVGLAADNTIEVPPDYTRAGWYRSSPTPGEKGPAIIVGHLDNIHGVAVFWRLQELIPGQTIEIDRQDGTTAKFIIEQVKQVPQNESFPTQEVYGNTDNAALRLITCGGTFNHLTQHYSDNTVVFASLLPNESKPTS